jgi:hypothetical protein
MVNNMTFANWLMNNKYPYVEAAEKYEIGQALTKEEAVHVKRILMRSYLDDNDMSILADTVEFGKYSNMEWLDLFVDLMESSGGAWSEMLWSTLDEKDRTQCMAILKDRKYQDEADEMEDE